MIRRRTLFEQPVIIHCNVFCFLVVGALCVLPWAAVTSAQDVKSGYQQPPEDGAAQPHPHIHRPLCPDGWVRGSTGGQSFKDKDAGLCLYLSPQALTWAEARQECRAKDSVLLSLDTVLSVEDRLFPHYLKDKGVGEVWTGMHKSGGRQIWDEPGKPMVKAYRGSRRILGESKRGWTWDSATFSDATLTCGLYSYSPDLPHSGAGKLQRRRRRRDSDTPRPGAARRGQNGGGAPPMAAFKSFLSSQGMKGFAAKLGDKAPEKAPLTGGLAVTARQNISSTKTPSRASDVKTNGPPHSSLDKHGSGVKDADSNNNNNNSNNDSPSSDDKNNSTAGAGNPSSDEDDGTHGLTKRSTPSGHTEKTTANPGDLHNATASSNATQQRDTAPIPQSTTTSYSSGDVTTASAGSPSGQAASPLKNDSASSASSASAAGLFGDNPGFGHEIMGFFNTDSKDAASSGSRGSAPASVPKTDTPSGSGDTVVQDASPPPVKEAQQPWSPQEFVQRFQTGASSSANNTKDVGSLSGATSQPASGQKSTPGVKPLKQVLNTLQTGLFGGAPATTAAPGSVNTTQDSSSEESTDTSQEETTTTTSTPPANPGGDIASSQAKAQGGDQGLFSESAQTSSSSSSSSSAFWRRFGPSSSSSSSSASPAKATGDTGAETTTTSTTTTYRKIIDDKLFQYKDILTYPTTTPMNRVSNDSAEVTLKPDSQEVTPKPDSQEVTPKPDSEEVTPKPDSQEVTPKPDSQEAGSKIIDDNLFRNKDILTYPTTTPMNRVSNDSQEVTAKPDSQEVTLKPDSAEVTRKFNSAEVTPKPDSQEVTPKPDSREITAKPDSQEVTLKPDSREITPKPDSQEATARQDSKEVQHVTASSPIMHSSQASMTTTSTTSGSSSSLGDSREGDATSTASSHVKESSEELQGDVPGSTTTRDRLRGVLQSMTPRPDHVLPSAGHSWMTLQSCQQREQFVCAAKPVHDFTTLPQCGVDWLGHSLVSRCYRLELDPLPYDQARARCQSLGGGLASTDTAFFANVTHLLLDRIRLLRGFTSPVWMKTASGVQQQQCSVMKPQVPGLQTLACHRPLPFLCQKAAFTPPPGANNKKGESGDDDDDEENWRVLEKPSMIRNMSSWNPQPLVCPVSPLLHQDTVIWFKDGQPIPSDAEDTGSSSVFPLSSNSRRPAVLPLNIQLLHRLGVRPRRMLQPALLQGVYWCRVWRQHPLRSITSDPFYVRFLDVVTLQGFLKTADITVAEAAFFNEMGDNSGVPSAIGHGMQAMNDRIYQRMRRSQPFLSDIVTTIQNADADTDEVEFRTYLCLSTGAMAPQDKGAAVDSYLTALHTEMVASEDHIRRDWNLTTSLEKSFRLLMTEMCPEARLVDHDTGYEATFGSTPVNQHAVSLDNCDGMFTGYAACRGDLMSGAYWAHWSVDMSCAHSANSGGVDSTEDGDRREPRGPRPKVDPDAVVDTGEGFVVPHKPNADLLDIDEVHIEQENVEDVTFRLAAILNTSVELTDADVEIVADVIDRVSLVPVLPQDVGLTLLKTVDRVLDSPLGTLHEAQRNSKASTRILQSLDKFSEKLQFRGHEDHVRYVTPNVAMEVWDTRAAREPVIGLAAMVGQSPDSPLADTRILTLNNRTWADLHLASLDVAIELPDQLVSGDGVGNGRLSMAIYRKPGLFLSSLAAQGSSGSSRDDDDDEALGPSGLQLNSVIISATLASTTVRGLKDNVKLIFRPLKTPAKDLPTRCMYWDFTLPAGGGWSSRGCSYNGTHQGRDICLCDHLTNFAVLLDFYGDGEPLDEANTTALSIITIIGLSLSILGLSLTVITFIFFKKLRQGRAQQTLFHMAVALLCSEVVLLAGLKQTTHDGMCIAVAALLHYFILASFLWMLVEAVLQYLTFVKVLGTYISKYTLKTVIPAWSIPLIPVIAVLATDYTQYRGRHDYCWMSLDVFYYAFALPVGVIILFNLVTFIVIMLSLLRRPEGLRSTRNKSNSTETNIKAAFTIFVLLGLTWTFGYLAIADARLPFQYMFTVTSSLQGFLIFVLLVARRRQFRDQWKALCCGRLRPAGGQKITPTLSNSASQSSTSSSFTSSSRSRTSSGGSAKTLDVLIKGADSNASHGKVQLSSKASTASTKSRHC